MVDWKRRIYYDHFLGLYNPHGWTVRELALMYGIGAVVGLSAPFVILWIL